MWCARFMTAMRDMANDSWWKDDHGLTHLWIGERRTSKASHPFVCFASVDLLAEQWLRRG
jgi:hypothetical protein